MFVARTAAKLAPMILRNLFLLLLPLFTLGAANAAPSLAFQQPTSAELYEPLAFTIDIDDAIYSDPFDAVDVELLGIFQSPGGQRVVARGFWMQPYDDNLQSASEPGWYVRFTPTEVGEWTYSLQVRDNGTIVTTEDGRFSVEPSSRRGFIRVGENGRYFQYDNGESYFPVGHNLSWGWEGGGGLEGYLDWLRVLSESGANYARIVIDVPWFIHLDWSTPVGDYRTVQRQAAQFDAVLNAAQEYGIALQVVLLWHQAIVIDNGPPVLIPEFPPRPNTSADWDDHPYNIVNGGPLSGPGVFFTNERAEALFRRRLDYIAARWGHHPQIFAWEITDRIDRISNYNPQTAGDWLQRMIGHLRRVDPNRHLITVGSHNFDAALAANPFLDFTTVQFYQRRPIETVTEQVAGAVNLLRRQLGLNPIPALMSSYSLNPWFEPLAEDPEGVHFQTTLWAAALSGAAGGAMSDWGETYVTRQALSRYYPALAAFTAGVDWAGLNLQPAEAGLLSEVAESYLPIRLSNFNRQFTAQAQDVVRRSVTADGVFPALDSVPSYLYGSVYNNQYSQAQLYRVAPSVDTYLEIGIRSVSEQARARLVVTVDNESALEVNLRAGARDTAVRVPLKAGEHLITLDNTGEDWLELDYIEVGQMIAPARALSLRDAQAGVALAWLQHRDYTWEAVEEGVRREPLLLQYRLDQMPPGRYVIEIWDPLAGGVIGEEVQTVSDDGILIVDLLPMDTMLALRVLRQPETEGAVDGDPVSPQVTAELLSATPAPATSQPPLVVQTNTPRPPATDTP